jgi:hypothetical protein
MAKRKLKQNLLEVPSIDEDRADVHLADWAELTASLNADSNVSTEDLKKAIQRAGKVSDTRAEAAAISAFNELEDRQNSCGVNSAGKQLYPFRLDGAKKLLTSVGVGGPAFIYKFLLCVSASSMGSTVRTRKNVDPTKAFERLCADVLASYWGHPDRGTGVIVFGTARNGKKALTSFSDKIDNLCEDLNEGVGWRKDALAPRGGDGKVDLVAWRKFADKRRGNLVGFAQCKTGTSWDRTLTEMVPEAFSATYMHTRLVLDPFRIFMVPERISDHRWEESTRLGGLLMDRCRIVEFSNKTSIAVKRECKVWLDDLIAEQKSIRRMTTN